MPRDSPARQITAAVSFVDGVSYTKLGTSPAPTSIHAQLFSTGNCLSVARILFDLTQLPWEAWDAGLAETWESLSPPGITDCTSLHAWNGVLYCVRVGISTTGPSTVLAFDGATWSIVGSPLNGRVTCIGDDGTRLVAAPVRVPTSATNHAPAVFEDGLSQIVQPITGFSWTSQLLRANSVSAIVPFRGELVFGGDFSQYVSSGVPRIARSIARIADSLLVPLPRLTGGWVNRMTTHQGSLIAVGSFALDGGPLPRRRTTISKRTTNAWVSDGGVILESNSNERMHSSEQTRWALCWWPVQHYRWGSRRVRCEADRSRLAGRVSARHDTRLCGLCR